jgi:predicted deacetylase
MMDSRYIIRMDDITPTMDWDRFWALLRLFNKHRIKPLLGIVPDNRDPNLDCQSPYPRFWETMRTLGERGFVEFGQHGYQHSLTIKPGAALLRATHGTTVIKSEFAGYSYSDQLNKIQEGQRLLKAQGINTSYWIAPNHSFDHTTLKALHASGFSAVSDGISLYPYEHLGLIFIPQQLWKPKWMPTGVFTICLHTNEIRNREIQRLRQFLRNPVRFTSFGHEVSTYKAQSVKAVANSLFKGSYVGARQIRKSLRAYGLLSGESGVTQSPLSEAASPAGRNQLSSQ